MVFVVQLFLLIFAKHTFIDFEYRTVSYNDYINTSCKPALINVI